jgi:hypothetical protein
MRIIAKNHDYYDSALAFGHDEHVVFERKEEEHVGDWKNPIPKDYGFMSPRMGRREMTYQWARGRREGNYDTNKTNHEFAYLPFTVAFCGKLYPGIRIDSRKNAMSTWSPNYAYTFDAYVALLNHFGIEFVEPQKRAWVTYGERKGSPKKEEDCKNYFERSGEDHIEFFAEHGQPIVVYSPEDPPTLLINCELKKFSFYKVFDAYTAFQELDMFISGIMTRDGNPMAGISDKDLRDKKGFDDMSFKKAPTKRR